MAIKAELTADLFAAASSKVDEAKVERAKKKATASKKAAKDAKAVEVAQVIEQLAIAAEKPEEKPAKTVELNGVSFKAGTDEKYLKNLASIGSKAAKKLVNNDKQMLSVYVDLGQFLSEAAKIIASRKDLGKFIAETMPESEQLDPALRSNSKWLYEELTNEESDLLDVLGVRKDGDNREPLDILKDFKSANPTVIRREYRKALAEREAPKGADGEVIEGEEPQVNEPQAPVDVASVLAAFRAILERAEDKESAIESAMETLHGLLMHDTKKDQLSFLQSLE